MRSTQTVRFLVPFGLLFAGYVCYALVEMNNRQVPWWNFSYGVLAAVALLCAWGLWHDRVWAYILSLVLAALGLGFGVYLAHFVWTFWIFKEPTLIERIGSVLHPRVSVFLVFPALWLIYFGRQLRKTFSKA